MRLDTFQSFALQTFLKDISRQNTSCGDFVRCVFCTNEFVYIFAVFIGPSIP